MKRWVFYHNAFGAYDIPVWNRCVLEFNPMCERYGVIGSRCLLVTVWCVMCHA